MVKVEGSAAIRSDIYMYPSGTLPSTFTVTGTSWEYRVTTWSVTAVREARSKVMLLRSTVSEVTSS